MRRSLAIAMLLTSALAALPARADDFGGIGESVGEDLYEKIDAGGYAAEAAFYDQALAGSAKELNALVRQDAALQAQLCGPAAPDCRVFVRNVDADALERAGRGDVAPVVAALNPAIKSGSMSVENLARLSAILQKYAALKAESVGEAAKKTQRLSLIGLYVDGDVDNSDYDIVADIEKINKRLFAKAPEYTGPTNRSKDSAGDLYSGPFLGGSNVERDGTGALASTGFAYKDAAARNCPAQPWDGGLVQEVNALLDPAGRDGWAPVDPLAGAGLSTGTPLAKPAVTGDCGDEIFCIDIKFITYQQNLLGYSRRPLSVENVVDKHLPQVEKLSGKSFAQSVHTTNFGQVGIGGNLYKLLVDNLSFKVELNFLPPPFLASKGLPKTPVPTPMNWDGAGALNEYFTQAGDGDMVVANMVAQEFKAEGISTDPARMNLLFGENADLKERTTVAQGEGGGVTDAAAKSEGAGPTKAQEETVRAVEEIAADAYVGGLAAKKLNENLLEVSTFANSLRQTVERLSAIVHSMAKKK